jgi:hypothetical protein
MEPLRGIQVGGNASLGYPMLQINHNNTPGFLRQDFIEKVPVPPVEVAVTMDTAQLVSSIDNLLGSIKVLTNTFEGLSQRVDKIEQEIQQLRKPWYIRLKDAIKLWLAKKR